MISPIIWGKYGHCNIESHLIWTSFSFKWKTTNQDCSVYLKKREFIVLGSWIIKSQLDPGSHVISLGHNVFLFLDSAAFYSNFICLNCQLHCPRQVLVPHIGEAALGEIWIYILYDQFWVKWKCWFQDWLRFEEVLGPWFSIWLVSSVWITFISSP